MDISVIIPTYGMPVFLSSAIESVLSQTFSDIELIVVDDNNPDTVARKQTEVILQKFISSDSRVKYIKHECNKNGAVARNTGFAIAQGKYVALLDSDDFYMPDRLQKCYDVMERAESEYAGVYTGCEFRRNRKTYNKYIDVKDGNFLIETLACTFMFCTGSNIFVRKSVIDELNGFDSTFLRQQDYEFLVRLFEKYSLKAIPEVLVIKNQENFNLPNTEKQIKIRGQYIAKYKYIIDSLNDEQKAYIYHSQAISLAEGAMRNKDYKIAKHYYAKAKGYGPLTRKEWFRKLMFPIFTLIH